MTIRKELLDILTCPQCRRMLQHREEKSGLICPACKLFYEIRDDIPIMLIDKALPLDDQKNIPEQIT